MDTVQPWTDVARGRFELSWLRGRLRTRRRVPEVLQLEATECGAACLAMMLRYYGCETTVADIRERCGVGRDGLNALALIRTAQRYGLRARGLSVQHANLKTIALPAIVHWQFNHFV